MMMPTTTAPTNLDELLQTIRAGLAQLGRRGRGKRR